MRNTLFLLLFSLTIQAQTFNFKCSTTPSEKTLEWYQQYVSAPDDWNGYLDAFVAEAAEYGIDLSHVYNEGNTINIGNVVNYLPSPCYWYAGCYDPFYNRDGSYSTLRGLARGQCDDEEVEIILDPLFARRTLAVRLWIAYHELGHDVLNLDHGIRNHLMSSSSPAVYITPADAGNYGSQVPRILTVASDEMFRDYAARNFGTQAHPTGANPTRGIQGNPHCGGIY